MFTKIRLRSLAALLVLAATVSVGAGITGAAGSTDANAVRDAAAAWIVPQVTAEGALISPYTSAPDPATTAQAALGLAGSGASPQTVARMIDYLKANVDAYVAPGGSADAPGALAWLILDAEATGNDAHAFGGVDLVARLEATQQPSGLFGSTDATYDGAFRQGLSLVALSSVGVSNPAGVAWLAAQQCGSGGFVALRTDTTTPCPAVDPSTFSGPDTNSTALAAMALHLAGENSAAEAAMNWLESVRTSGGGFSYLGDASLEQDANSTGLVALAFRTVNGVEDADSVAALASLQVPSSGDPADRGGIAFQAGDPLFPDLMATTQALLGLAGQALPFAPVTPEEPTTSTSLPSGPSPSTPSGPSSSTPGSVTTLGPVTTLAPPSTPAPQVTTTLPSAQVKPAAAPAATAIQAAPAYTG